MPYKKIFKRAVKTARKKLKKTIKGVVKKAEKRREAFQKSYDKAYKKSYEKQFYKTFEKKGLIRRPKGGYTAKHKKQINKLMDVSKDLPKAMRKGGVKFRSSTSLINRIGPDEFHKLMRKQAKSKKPTLGLGSFFEGPLEGVPKRRIPKLRRKSRKK